jgi:radical SAM protein with 4Fe4S-binding SPASM domain
MGRPQIYNSLESSSSDLALDRAICHFPWNTAYVEPDGRVYPCCHRKPHAVGNINHQSLSEIMYGPDAESVRRRARAGDLVCFPTCTRAPSRHVHRSGGKPYKVPPEPRLEEVHLNVSYRCNIRCVMCGQDHKSRLTLNAKRIIQAVDWSEKPRLILQGGEPLVIPEARKVAAYVAGKTESLITLITNGTALSGRWEDILLSRNHEIRLSLNAATKETHERVNIGSKWPKVVNNLRRLVQRREQTGSGLYITLRMTVVPENVHEMPSFVRFATSEGFADRITFGFDKKTLPKWAKKNRPEFERIYHAFLDELDQSKALCDAWRMYQVARKVGIESRPLKFGRKGQLLGYSTDNRTRTG